jgi:hypothetical protein
MQVEPSLAKNSPPLFRYNPLDPAYWTVFCRLTLILSSGLILDWILGYKLSLTPITSNYITRTTPNIAISPLNLFTYLAIFATFPFLNDDVDAAPFFMACLIKILLFIGAGYYTVLGSIAGFLLGLTCSIVIGTVLVLNILFGSDEPLKATFLFLLAFALVALQIIIDMFFAQIQANMIQILIYIVIFFIGLTLINTKAKFLGAVLFVFVGFFDMMVFSINGSGFGAGGSIISIGAVILILKNFPKKE